MSDLPGVGVLYKVTALRLNSAGTVVSRSSKIVGASASPLKYTGLVNGAKYKFQVQATNTPAGQTKVWGALGPLQHGDGPLATSRAQPRPHEGGDLRAAPFGRGAPRVSRLKGA